MSKNLFEMFETDENYEINGVWQDFGTARVLLARSGGQNTSYFKTLSNELKNCGKATYESLDEEEAKDLLMKTYIKSVIKDHEVKDENGKMVKGVPIKKDNKVVIVPFNNKNMETCLKQLPEYFKKIQEYSDTFTTFRTEVEKEQIKK